MSSIHPDLSKIPHAKLQKLIDKVRARIKKHSVVKRIFEEHGLDVSEVDLIPICFAKLDVSARTDHGIIYCNYDLLNDGDFDKDDHYLVHEFTHWAQQTTGTKPTKGSDSGSYLDNKEEREGFKNQTEYISDTRGDDAAERYVEELLDHHDIDDKSERKTRMKQLLQLSES